MSGITNRPLVSVMALLCLSLLGCGGGVDPTDPCLEPGNPDCVVEPACDPEPGDLCTWLGQFRPGSSQSDPTPVADATLRFPMDLDFAPDGSAYFADWLNHSIRAVRDGEVHTVVGTRREAEVVFGPGTDSPLDNPTSVAISPTGYVAIAAWHNSMVVGWNPETEEVEPICGSGTREWSGDGGPALDANVDLPAAVTYDETGLLIIVDQASQRLRRIDETGVIDTFAGTGEPGFAGDGGPAIEAEIHAPVGQTALPAGGITVTDDGTIYHADSGNDRVRRIDPDGTITTIAGNGDPGYSGDGGAATDAELNRPCDVAVDAEGRVYIADTDNHCVRRVDTDGTIHTAIGTCTARGDRGDGGPATEARLDRPYGVSVGPEGFVYVVDTYNHRIRRMLPTD
ncbi:MAG: hypothetical protein VYE15_03300 [Myxococcota bacterium]|nr:hypothetical protein [Myxococcota bacterium]